MNNELYSIKDKVAVISGGGGVLGSNIAKHLLKAGAKVVIIDIRQEPLDTKLAEFKEISEHCVGYIGNVLEKESLENVRKQIIDKWGRIDILVNAAGGNIPGATLTEEQTFFDMKMSDFNKVTDLNLNGSVLPCMVFGETMADQKSGAIVNISSMATYSAITRVPGYSVAKSGINIFTQWLASEMALKFGEGIRVNAIAPGFFIGDQNRKVLINEDGSLTDRSKKVMARTPMNRFGNIDELNGTVQFLCSDAATFITGAILPIDGGFSAFSGV
jgi:NAD(P)-dependent dehydrogenase (short-subunit alcohol dehydrogenase family)